MSSNTSRLKAHLGICRLFMKEIFDAYVLVDLLTKSLATCVIYCDFSVSIEKIFQKVSHEIVKVFFLMLLQKCFSTIVDSSMFLLWLHGWSRSVNLERLAIYWPGCVFWAFLWLFPALKLKPHSTEAKYAPLVLIFHVAILVVF